VGWAGCDSHGKEEKFALVFCGKNLTKETTVKTRRRWEVSINKIGNKEVDGFGGLVVRMLASGSRVRGFKPGRSRWIFLYIKILSLPSFGGEVQ
jgi:hypothetical protein